MNVSDPPEGLHPDQRGCRERTQVIEESAGVLPLMTMRFTEVIKREFGLSKNVSKPQLAIR